MILPIESEIYDLGLGCDVSRTDLGRGIGLQDQAVILLGNGKARMEPSYMILVPRRADRWRNSPDEAPRLTRCKAVMHAP